VTLSWQVNGADTVSIDQAIGTVTGTSTTVTVTASTTFTLTATGVGGTSTATAQVTVGAPTVPVIRSFTAAPTSLRVGGVTVTLSWQVDGASALAIDNGVGAVTGQSISVMVTASRTFTLTATNVAGSATATASVTVATGPVAPTIARFTVTPATLPAGGGTVTLSWQVSGADTVSIDRGVGAVTGSSLSLGVTTTTVYTLTATNAGGTSTSSTAVVVGSNPSRSGGRFVAMVIPVNGESFTAPASLRLIAAGRDPNIDTNNPAPGLGGNAAKVQFFVDDGMVLEVAGSSAEYWIFQGFTGGVTSGLRRVWARAIYTNPDLVLDSDPVLVRVDAPPSYAQTVNLSGDLTLSGPSYSLEGTATARLRVNGNGHRIVTAPGAATAIRFRYVDFFGMGDPSSTATPGIDVATDGSLEVTGCNFDGSNIVQLAVTGAAPATVRGNNFRSNMRQPIGQNPGAAPTGPSYPVVVLRGISTGTKVFQGNNVGAGWVFLSGTRGWLVGGDADADGNVLVGARVGIYADASQDLQIRRNYSHHIYYGGWSQGSNFELGGIASLTAEHNVVAGSSWPVRGVAGEFRYNLVLEAGHQWMWADHSGAYVHHNVFVGGDADIGGIFALYSPTGVRIQNNTIDGLGGDSVFAALRLTNGSVSLSSNLILNVRPIPVRIDGGSLEADYNLFWNCGTPFYSDGRAPAHDVLASPLLQGPPSTTYPFDETALWMRTLTVRQVLAQYRMMYMPGAGSPAIDAGDPAGGAGNDIGAIGAGTPNPADRFGL
jgi:hypothetical protein